MPKRILIAVSVLLCILLIAGCTSKNEPDVSKKQTSDITSDVTSDITSDVTSDVSSEDAPSSSDKTTADFTDKKTNSWLSKDNASSTANSNSLMKNEIIPSGNTSVLLKNVSGGADAEANAMRNKILNSKDSLKVSGTKYYISSKSGNDDNDGLTPQTAWQTADAATLNSFLFKPGDAVLFERGCVFRTTSQIFCKTGVSYGAYGTGEKPVIYGSVRNYSYPGLWTPSNKKNVWKMTVILEDAGIIVFEHGKAVGDKKNGLLSVTENYDFYHNVTENVLYLYLDKGRPNQVFKDIEIGTRRAIFTLVNGVTDVHIDNICMKYSGNFAVQCIASQKNVKITNCEIGWIGGCYMEDGKQSRYGNGIQFWDDASNCTVDNCWVYQIYDTGITFQGPEDAIYENVDFTNNLVEYTCMAIEFWVGTGKYGRPMTGYVKDCDITGNILRFSGYEWSSAMRPNPIQTSFIQGGNEGQYEIKSMNIKNNIFDKSAYYFLKWSKSDLANVSLGNNTYYGQNSLVNDPILYDKVDNVITVNNLDTLKKAVLDIEPTAKKISWCE